MIRDVNQFYRFLFQDICHEPMTIYLNLGEVLFRRLHRTGPDPVLKVHLASTYPEPVIIWIAHEKNPNSTSTVCLHSSISVMTSSVATSTLTSTAIATTSTSTSSHSSSGATGVGYGVGLGVGVTCLVLAGLSLCFLSRRRRKRKAQAAQQTDYHPERIHPYKGDLNTPGRPTELSPQ